MWLLLVLACKTPLDSESPPDTEPQDSAVDSDVDTDVVPDTDTDIGPPPGPREWPLRDATLLNHLLPYDVVVDAAARRAYSLSLAFGNLAVIDIDTGVLLDVIGVNPIAPSGPRAGGPLSLAMAADGAVWVLGGEPVLVRVDPVGRKSRSVPTDFVIVTSLLSRADGAVLVSGSTAEGAARVDVIAPSNVVLASFPMTEGPRAMLRLGDETFAALLRSGGVEIRRFDDGSLVTSCPSQQEAYAFAALPTGDFVVIDGTRTSLVPCSGGAGVTVEAGRDLQGVVAIPSGVLVLDRLSAVPHLAEATRYDSALAPIGSSFATGNHTGYGELDAVTGRVWANAEGWTEVVAIDPDSGLLAARVRTGDHIEEAVRDPEDRDRAFVVGRLTDTFAAVDLETGAVTPIAGPRWPMAPVVVGRTLFVLGGIDQRLYAFDADTLEAAGSWDLGVSANHGYTLPDLAWDEARGTLWATAGDDGAVVGFDPVEGRLRGPPVVMVPRDFSSEIVNRLEVHVGAEAVFVVRAADGVIGRLVPETGAVTGGAPVSGLLDVGTRLSLAAIGGDGRLWVGPWVVDPATLERVPDVEAPWTFPVGPDGDAMIGWDGASQSIVRVGADGAVGETWASGPFGNADPALEVRAGRVLFTHLRDGILYDWPLD